MYYANFIYICDNYYNSLSKLTMQMSDLSNLPSRNTQLPNKVKLTTNLYEIRLDKLKATFFLYHFKQTQSQSAQQGLEAFREHKQRQLLSKKIGYICEFKRGLLGSKRIDDIIQVAEQSNSKAGSSLKLGQTLELQGLMGETCRQRVLNSLISPIVNKSVQNSEKSTRQDYIGTHRIVLTPTFRFSLVEMKKKFFLSTNISMQIKEHCSLLVYFERYDRESIKTLLIGREVVANYGTRNVYTIADVDFTKSVESKGVFGGKQCSYIQFYKEKYSLTISNAKQPLLLAKTKGKGIQSPIYLVPELVSLHNAISPNDFTQQMKEKLQKKKLQLPQAKEVFAVRVLKQLGQGQIIKKSAHNFDGFQLESPAISIDKQSIAPQEGLVNFRGKILKPVEMKNWGLVYLQGKDKQQDNNDISRLLFYFKAVSPQYGVKMSNQPGFIPISSLDVAEWNKAISKDVERYGAPQFMIFFLREEEVSLYADLKKTIMQHKFPSQVIRRKTLESSNKKPFTIVSNILLQIQAKIGAVPWEIKSSTDLSKRKAMFGGIHISKQDQLLNFSLVGGMNPQGSQVYSYCKRGIEYKDINFQMLMMYWAKNYVSHNKFAPDTIIIYREELKDYSERKMIEKELGQIKTAIKKIGEKIKIANYSPSISYLVVSRTHGVQIYSRAENQHKDFILQNPSTGTVVIDRQQDDETYDFYLNSGRSFDRTDRPTKFTVVQSSQMSAQSLIGFTYEECYNYFSFKGGVRMPACLQYARKLSSFSQSTSVQLGYEERANKMFYFL